MSSKLQFALLLPLATLVGCSLPPATSSSTSTAPTGEWTNWQIQAGTAITSPPNTYPSFLGALQLQGTQAAGVFTTVVAAGASGGALDYSGDFNSSTGTVELTAQGFEFEFAEPATPNTLTQVGVTGGCVGDPPPACLAIFTSPSVGVQIAPISGAYAGTLTASTEGDSGQATLSITQSTTPNADGSFSLTGTITFPAGSGLGTYPLGGTIGGEGIILYDPTPGIVPVVSLTASTNPAATQIVVGNLAFAVTASNIVTFTGTLTRQ